jgi:hypothetical protein
LSIWLSLAEVGVVAWVNHKEMVAVAEQEDSVQAQGYQLLRERTIRLLSVAVARVEQLAQMLAYKEAILYLARSPARGVVVDQLVVMLGQEQQLEALVVVEEVAVLQVHQEKKLERLEIRQTHHHLKVTMVAMETPQDKGMVVEEVAVLLR